MAAPGHGACSPFGSFVRSSWFWLACLVGLSVCLHAYMLTCLHACYCCLFARLVGYLLGWVLGWFNTVASNRSSELRFCGGCGSARARRFGHTEAGQPGARMEDRHGGQVIVLCLLASCAYDRYVGVIDCASFLYHLQLILLREKSCPRVQSETRHMIDHPTNRGLAPLAAYVT